MMMEGSSGKNILFIAYYFPPMQSIGVWRNYFLAREASKEFDKVFVSVKRLNNAEFANNGRADNFQIIQNPAPDYRYFLGNKEKVGFSEGVKRSWFSKFFIRLINSFPFNIILGEGGFVYLIASVINISRLTRRHHIGFIYSSFRPMTDHAVAYCLKRMNKKLIWTADFRDLPFDPLYKQYFCYGFQKWAMKLLLSQADVITAFSPGIAEGLRKLTHKEIVVLENGPFEEYSEKRTPVHQQKIFTIQYAGSLFQDERNPKLLLQVISELKHEQLIPADAILLKYAGKDNVQWATEVKKFGLEDISHIQGLVSRSEAAGLQAEAHVNLLLTSAHPDYQGILTGKFFELILTGHPIICLINGTADPGIEELFRKYNLGIVVYDRDEDKGRLKEFLITLFENFTRTGKTGWKIEERILDDFNWSKTVRKWKNILNLTEEKRKET